jgi:uncharacterized membrane protein
MRVADPQSPQQQAGLGRMSGFSDGFFAIVITLLVLDIQPPSLPEDASEYLLRRELGRLWPSAAAFLISFVNILILWINHHELTRLTVRATTPVLYLNGLLLLGVALSPFSTALLSEHILGPGAQLAAAVYCGVFAWIALCFNLLWGYVAGQRDALDETVTRRDRRRISRTYLGALLLYGGCAALSFASPLASVAATLAMAGFFAVADRLSGFASEDLLNEEE